jgi:hypothetical protein
MDEPSKLSDVSMLAQIERGGGNPAVFGVGKLFFSLRQYGVLQMTGFLCLILLSLAATRCGTLPYLWQKVL